MSVLIKLYLTVRRDELISVCFEMTTDTLFTFVVTPSRGVGQKQSASCQFSESVKICSEVWPFLEASKCKFSLVVVVKSWQEK